jgi:hypothetical protein
MTQEMIRSLRGHAFKLHKTFGSVKLQSGDDTCISLQQCTSPSEPSKSVGPFFFFIQMVLIFCEKESLSI